MTPQIALAMLLLSNLALLVLYIHMEREIDRLKNEFKNYPVFLNGIRLYGTRIFYDERKQQYKIFGSVTNEDLREATRNDRDK